MRPSLPVSIFDHTGTPIAATIYLGLGPHNLTDFADRWVPELQKIYAEDAHWDWNTKLSRANPGFSRTYALECAGATEGLMQVRLSYISHVDRKNVLYLDYLQAAPWNRKRVNPKPLYNGIGTILATLAVVASADEDMEGRVALHSLPGALSFYTNKLGFTDYGPDPDYPHNLNYLELDRNAARVIIDRVVEG